MAKELQVAKLAKLAFRPRPNLAPFGNGARQLFHPLGQFNATHFKFNLFRDLVPINIYIYI